MILNLSRAEAQALRDWLVSHGRDADPVLEKLDRVLDGARIYEVHADQTTVYDQLEAA